MCIGIGRSYKSTDDNEAEREGFKTIWIHPCIVVIASGDIQTLRLSFIKQEQKPRKTDNNQHVQQQQNH